MNLKIIDKHFGLDVYGFSGTAIAKDYAGSAFKLMDKMWKVVKLHNLKNKGLNIWVYDTDERVFAGVELETVPPHDTGLERKSISFAKYAYYKHVGPYNLIKQAGQAMQDELKKSGLTASFPYLEIYGHWTNDETKLETELLMRVE
jgi:hypothetical protein